MSQTAVLLLGHGSRAAEANEGMYRVIESLRRSGPYDIVEAGFMELNPPSIEESAAVCVEKGADTILMVPYFLHMGMHIRKDIPEIVEALRVTYPDVRFFLGPPLGYSEKLADIVRERLAETVAEAGLSDPEESESDPPPPTRPLRSGFTTGACAAAASGAAARALVTGQSVDEVTIALPAGFDATFAVERCVLQAGRVLASIRKDAGDDPDVTHGAEIIAEVMWSGEPGITIERGPGVGIVTKPGLELPVGEPAINPVPRKMIREAIERAIGEDAVSRGLRVIISVPNGEELAKKTLNSRLGITGGLSILGTTGVVLPYSTEAYTHSISQGLSVAAAVGCRQVVLTTGRRSEKHAQALYQLPEEAFIQMGDFAGFALDECVARGMEKVAVCAMVGKLVKLAAGNFQTHYTQSEVDFGFLAAVALAKGASPADARALAAANTARHVLDLVRERGLDPILSAIPEIAARQCHERVEGKLAIETVLLDFDGTVIGRVAVG